MGNHLSRVCNTIQKGCVFNQQILLNANYIPGNGMEAGDLRVNIIRCRIHTLKEFTSSSGDRH